MKDILLPFFTGNVFLPFSFAVLDFLCGKNNSVYDRKIQFLVISWPEEKFLFDSIVDVLFPSLTGNILFPVQ